MDDRLKELKQTYKEMASTKASDRFMAEIAKEVEERLKIREEDLMTPHTCNAAYIYHPAGAALDEIEPFTSELTEVVDKMKEELLNEMRLLEGTDVPEYNENELSQPKPTEEQWKSDSQNGCLITDPTLNSIIESNSLSSFVEVLNPEQDMVYLSEKYEVESTNSCSGKLDDSGIEIDATNEFSECTVPMISEQMLGMPNEEK